MKKECFESSKSGSLSQNSENKTVSPTSTLDSIALGSKLLIEENPEIMEALRECTCENLNKNMQQHLATENLSLSLKKEG